MSDLGLDSTEWNFSSIPEDELETACWYEYAREAERELCRLAEWRKRVREISIKATTWHPDRWYSQKLRDEVQSLFRIEQMPGGPGPALPLLQYSINPDLKTAFFEERSPVYVKPPAWVLLTDDQKRMIWEVFKCIIQKWVDPSACKIVPWDSIKMRVHYLNGSGVCDLGVDKLQDGPSIGPLGDALVLLNLDLQHRTDREIVDAFEELLHHIRERAKERFGESAGGPVKRGKKTSDSRHRLRSLGWMRLRHGLEPGDVIAKIESFAPDTWPDDATIAEKREFLEESRGRVLAWFREYFPQLGPDGEPEHYKTLRERGQ